MLGLILIYFIWKNYSELAFEYNKNRWGYGLLGIASYYGGTIIAGFIFGIIMELVNPSVVENMNDIVVNLICFPFGIVSVWGLHKILKNRWSNTAQMLGEDALDSELFRTKTGE